MALTLDATLATAMDAQSRHPLVEIISKETVDSIPFDGEYLSTGTTDEKYPATIMHSTGRLCAAYYYAGNIRYQYSDVDRTYFTAVDINISGEALDMCLCELVNGNIGIVYRTTGALKYRIITVTGTAVSNGTIETISSSYITGPFVIKLADDSYLMVYGKKITGDSHYHLYKYTSANFTSWTGPAELSISGLTDTLRKGNPSLIQITTGDIWLWFDYREQVGTYGEELINIYYSVSADNGSTWGAATKVTAFTGYTEIGYHPVAVQKAADAMHMAYTFQTAAMKMNNSTSGWPDIEAQSGIGQMHFDAVHRKLYVVPMYDYIPNFFINGVVKIDVDTWTVDRYWNWESAAPLLQIYGDHASVKPFKWFGSGQYVVFGVFWGSIVSVVEGENDNVRDYHFADNAVYGYECNVDVGSIGNVCGAYFEESQMRLYVMIANNSTLYIGYFDYTETIAAGGKYTFTILVTESMAGWEEFSLTDGAFMLRVQPEDDVILFSPSISTLAGNGLYLFNLSTGALWKEYRYNADSMPDFPRFGINSPVYINGKIYGGITNYEAGYGQGDIRGLCIVDTGTDAITYERPDWGTYDNYYLSGLKEISGDRLLMASYYGVTIYDIANDTWTLFDNALYPGLTDGGNNVFSIVEYDEAGGMITGGYGWGLWPTSGLTMFSEYGHLKQANYYTGSYNVTWDWTDQGDLVEGYQDYDASICLDPDDQAIYALWERLSRGPEYSIKWDKEGADFDLSAYITRNEQISVKRSIDGNPASLSFTVSHGHLFDPSNNSSLLTPYLKKGRKLTLRFGEKISGTDYWHNMGTFIVTEQSVSYKRGTYPVMGITAEDVMHLWNDLTIVVSQYYGGSYPETIIADLITDNTDIESADIDIDNFDGRTRLYYQVVDTSLMEAIQKILDRYGYYIRVDVDGDIGCRKISDGNSVDHAFTDTTKLINWTPDDSYSDFVNKIIVTGTERTEIEVLYEEERVGSINGTCGWWGGKKEHQVYYSNDSSRKCRYPRLVVLESATSIAFELAGSISEDIEATSEYYCTIIVDCPDLTPLLVAACAGLLGSFFLPDMVVEAPGHTIRVGSMITGFFALAALQILGATGSYQYEVWARPVGTVKRSVQGTWEDTAAQTETGCVILKKFDDTLCYSAAECAAVAEIEGMVTQLQRKRVKFEKVADLRDEDGDTISVIHPYTGQAIAVFVTDIERVMVIPESEGTGEFTDRIEGWRI